jgi:hypothetical protein
LAKLVVFVGTSVASDNKAIPRQNHHFLEKFENMGQLKSKHLNHDQLAWMCLLI